MTDPRQEERCFGIYTSIPRKVGDRGLKAVHTDRRHRRRVRCAAQQPRLPPGLPGGRIKANVTQKDGPALSGRLLRRLCNLMGIVPVGTLARLTTGEVAVLTHEHPSDPLRTQVERVKDPAGRDLAQESLITRETDDRGQFRHGVEALDPDAVAVDPLSPL